VKPIIDALGPIERYPHVILVLGKGGVGKTTVSMLLARALSFQGKTLLVSLDPAKHLVKYLGLEGLGLEVKVSNTLFIKQVSIEEEIKGITGRYAELLKELMPSLSVLNIDNVVDAVKYSPGVEEEILLMKLNEAFKSSFTYVVVDTPPTGITLRTLLLPSLYLTWIEKLITIRERIVSLRYAIAKVLGRLAEVKDRALVRLYEMKKDLNLLNEVLRSPAAVSYVVVAVPEPLPMYELEETINFLTGKLKIKPRLLVLNKVLREEVAEKLGVSDMQKRYLESIRSRGVSYALIEHLGKPTESLTDVAELEERVRVFKH